MEKKQVFTYLEEQIHRQIVQSRQTALGIPLYHSLFLLNRLYIFGFFELYGLGLAPFTGSSTINGFAHR
jgi:hypothetical protein